LCWFSDRWREIGFDAVERIHRILDTSKECITWATEQPANFAGEMVMIDNQFATAIILTDGTDPALCLQHSGVIVHRQAKVQAQPLMDGTGLDRLFVLGIIGSGSCAYGFRMVEIIRPMIRKLLISGLLVSRLMIGMHAFFTKFLGLSGAEVLGLREGTCLAQRLSQKIRFVFPGEFLSRFFLPANSTDARLHRRDALGISPAHCFLRIARLADVPMHFVVFVCPDKIINGLRLLTYQARALWWFLKWGPWSSWQRLQQRMIQAKYLSALLSIPALLFSMAGFAGITAGGARLALAGKLALGFLSITDTTNQCGHMVSIY
jgi:hypothetical protein